MQKDKNLEVREASSSHLKMQELHQLPNRPNLRHFFIKWSHRRTCFKGLCGRVSGRGRKTSPRWKARSTFLCTFKFGSTLKSPETKNNQNLVLLQQKMCCFVCKLWLSIALNYNCLKGQIKSEWIYEVIDFPN